jgi:2-desacetyl-2-hydroxyethyl bacteriochlorophyllide A dehydrogenase
MEQKSLYFTAPGQVEIRRASLTAPGPGYVLVETLLSAISPGTEGLIYRGQFPDGLALDESLSALAGGFGYPLKYGYATVGRVSALGEGVDSVWYGRLVFAFHPHESCFLIPVDELMLVPEDMAAEGAIFLPNMETAVNFVMDGAPLLGEQVVVFGQGVVGLLTSALLARFPLGRLVTLDRYPLRRQASLALGVHASLDPEADDCLEQFHDLLPKGADLAYELSGSPAALDQAIAATGFAGRVVIGSWYGKKSASLNLGGRFHRSRIRLVSSQVSNLAPELTGRWDKLRRFAVAWEMLRLVQPSRWITHRFPLEQAPQAYQLLDQHPEQAIQVVFTHS